MHVHIIFCCFGYFGRKRFFTVPEIVWCIWREKFGHPNPSTMNCMIAGWYVKMMVWCRLSDVYHGGRRKMPVLQIKCRKETQQIQINLSKNNCFLPLEAMLLPNLARNKRLRLESFLNSNIIDCSKVKTKGTVVRDENEWLSASPDGVMNNSELLKIYIVSLCQWPQQHYRK